MSWDSKSKGIVQAYRRYSGMSDAVYRDKLHRCTGATSSRDAHLCGHHFEAFMPLMEVAAHLAETNGLAVGRRPRQIQDWYYWRNRYRRPGLATYAQFHRINKLWADLMGYLPASEQTGAYLLGICDHAAGHRIQALYDLKSHEAALVIEALKDRLAHAMRRPA